MGYYTMYSLQARKVENKEQFESIVQALKDMELYGEGCYGVFMESTYFEDSNEATFSAYDECRWYDHDYDMMKLCKMFPNVIFKLSGEGEEREDMWRKYFHNGEIEECRAQVTFAKPVWIEWDE